MHEINRENRVMQSQTDKFLLHYDSGPSFLINRISKREKKISNSHIAVDSTEWCVQSIFRSRQLLLNTAYSLYRNTYDTAGHAIKDDFIEIIKSCVTIFKSPRFSSVGKYFPLIIKLFSFIRTSLISIYVQLGYRTHERSF